MPGDMKAKIADTLNEILKLKELDKITVKELVDACNHFIITFRILWRLWSGIRIRH